MRHVGNDRPYCGCLLVFLMLLLVETTGAQVSGAACGEADESAARQYPDLYCIDLVPTGAAPDASAAARLILPSTPFGAAVTRDGVQRFKIELEAANLPDPSELGPYTVYVAWAVPPNLHPYTRLGVVGNGRHREGEVALNKFLVFVTAESTSDGREPEGRIVLRGQSPSSVLQPHDLFSLSPLAAFSRVEDDDPAEHQHPHSEWMMPPMHPATPMVPGMGGLAPSVEPYLPSAPHPEGVPLVRRTQYMKLTNGDSLTLKAGLVRRTIKERELLMYGFNGQSPGPLLHVQEAATVHVRFENNLEHPTAVHWHGVRLDNRFDGVPGLTQEPVGPGESFEYTIHFPDAGLFWYHPHHREDIQQDLGLYGNLLVRSGDPDYLSPVNREEVLMLDDLLLGEEGLVPYGASSSNYMLMGRFGNVLLVNGEPSYSLKVKQGEVVRFYLTNVSNTRPLNLSLGDATMKVVASDLGKYERESMVESIVISPAERYIVDAYFPDAGTYLILNRVHGLNHRTGAFFPEVDTLGSISVSDVPTDENHVDAFRRLRVNADVSADIEKYRPEFSRPPDKELLMTLEVDDLPEVVRQMMRLDPIYFNAVEWTDTMPMMNWITTGDQIRWILRDPETGKENMEIDWTFSEGDVIKLLVKNDRNAFHSMQHPLHVHGQRLLVISVNGEPDDNLVWKDTVLLPAGSEAELLLDLSNPGKWMVHCHIAEHLDSGMMMVMNVVE
jgi:FtsP/CotA-like multicopper oxidase with cupredoxin domain